MGFLLAFLGFFSAYYLLFLAINPEFLLEQLSNEDYEFVYTALFSLFILAANVLYWLNVALKKMYVREIKEKSYEIELKKKALDGDYKKKLLVYNSKMSALDEREKEINRVLVSTSPFREVAIMAADFQTHLYKKDEDYLRYKPHPALNSASKLKEIRQACESKLKEYNEVLYKYNFILKVFPEIKMYVENDLELLSIAKYVSYSDLEDNRDRSRDYLTSEEWSKLTSVERNQLALDRYVQGRKKSAWAIGRDYEMSCAFFLESSGCIVEMHGIEKGKEDLGRDIIAYRYERNIFGVDYTKGEIWIIQCKCWSKDHPVRENVVMQLFGTYIAYKIENGKKIPQGIEIIPVLMIPPFTVVSDTAKRFMNILGVRLKVQEFNDFPRIKCNINNNNKIYHLPFDQQYDNTQIKNQGEFYAWTVAEAENEGFRRAMRHMF